MLSITSCVSVKSQSLAANIANKYASVNIRSVDNRWHTFQTLIFQEIGSTCLGDVLVKYRNLKAAENLGYSNTMRLTESKLTTRPFCRTQTNGTNNQNNLNCMIIYGKQICPIWNNWDSKSACGTQLPFPLSCKIKKGKWVSLTPWVYTKHKLISSSKSIALVLCMVVHETNEPNLSVDLELSSTHSQPRESPFRSSMISSQTFAHLYYMAPTHGNIMLHMVLCTDQRLIVNACTSYSRCV